MIVEAEATRERNGGKNCLEESNRGISGGGRLAGRDQEILSFYLADFLDFLLVRLLF